MSKERNRSTSTRLAPKKWVEQLYLESFLKVIRRSVDKISPAEAPDFILCRGKERIGIEVTQLFGDEQGDGSLRKEEEAVRKRFLRRLSAEYYRRDTPPLLVKISGRSFPEERVIPNLAESLREAAGRSAPWDHRKILSEGHPSVTLWVTRLPDHPRLGDYRRWVAIENQIGWRRQMKASYLQERINEKAGKLNEYLAKVDQCMLLLVTDQSQMSGFLDYKQEDLVRVSPEGFKAVYLHQFPKGGVIQCA